MCVGPDVGSRQGLWTVQILSVVGLFGLGNKEDREKNQIGQSFDVEGENEEKGDRVRSMEETE